MTVFNLLATLVGLTLALIGIGLTIRSLRRRLVTCDLRGPLSLISILPDATGGKLSVFYEKSPGVAPVEIKNAYLHYVRIANLGRESVRQSDLAPDDPLRIEIRAGNVLELAVAEVTRPVLGFQLRPLREQDAVIVAPISFDFLDHQDGAIIRILTDDQFSRITVAGTIIGMPSGIRWSRARKTPPSVRKLAYSLKVLCYLAIVAGTIFLPALVGSELLSMGLMLVLAIIVVFFLIWLEGVIKPDPDAGWPKGLKLPFSAGFGDFSNK